MEVSAANHEYSNQRQSEIHGFFALKYGAQNDSIVGIAPEPRIPNP